MRTRCNIKKQINAEKEDIYKNLLKELQEIKNENRHLRHAVDKLNKKCNCVTTNNNTNNNTNNTINNVHTAKKTEVN